jgi:hypothetical protein
MVATRRPGFDSSLERIYGTGLKNFFAGETGVREFSKPGFDSLLLMKTVRRSKPHRLSLQQF